MGFSCLQFSILNQLVRSAPAINSLATNPALAVTVFAPTDAAIK